MLSKFQVPEFYSRLETNRDIHQFIIYNKKKAPPYEKITKKFKTKNLIIRKRDLEKPEFN